MPDRLSNVFRCPRISADKLAALRVSQRLGQKPQTFTRGTWSKIQNTSALFARRGRVLHIESRRSVVARLIKSENYLRDDASGTKVISSRPKTKANIVFNCEVASGQCPTDKDLGHVTTSNNSKAPRPSTASSEDKQLTKR